MRRLVVCSLAVLATGVAHALPPDERGRGFVEGANHHVGDAGFIAARGRAPTADDAEKERMHTHLAWIRAELGRRPATRPELEARRQTLLGYLDDYIARGTTPLNVALPWRNPVFIDPLGQICAVGYLIERDPVAGGRDVAEAIAAAHRFDYLEDIAAAMPSVAAWIDGSGFTLEELASIQPGYMRPALDGWLLEKKGRVDLDGVVQTELGGKVVGGGDLTRGSGRWKSYYGDGKVLAEGDYRGGRAHGPWRVYHESGRLAAQGRFARGEPSGAWTFYADDDAHTPLSRGAVGGARWTHFGPDGAPLATTRMVDRADDRTSGGEYVLDFRYPSDRGVRVQLHEGNVAGDYSALSIIEVDGLRFAADSMWDGEPTLWDARGRIVTRAPDGGWTRATCRDAVRASLVKSGDIAIAHDLDEGPTCPVEPLTERDAARFERWWAAYHGPQPPVPAHLVRLSAFAQEVRARRAGWWTEPDPDDSAVQDATVDSADDQEHGVVSHDGGGWLEVLAASMTWYAEPPQVDGLFELVYATLPDRCYHDAADSCDDEG